MPYLLEQAVGFFNAFRLEKKMINIRAFMTHPIKRISLKETLRYARNVLEKEGYDDAEINIVFVNDAEMIKLNGKYRNHWNVTDVLSFDLSERNTKKLEGEVYVNVEQAYLQGKELNVGFKNEIARLVVHGILHLTGYNDDTIQRKKAMTSREDFYIQCKG